LATVLVLALWVSPASAGFRLAPYVQNPTDTGITLVWFSENAQPGEVSVHQAEGPLVATIESHPVPAAALAYHPSEPDEQTSGVPFKHELRLHGLAPGHSYSYTVRQGGAEAGGRFTTKPARPERLRIIAFADSETEPESVGKPAKWPGPGPGDADRRYLVDQERGYRENLRIIESRAPDFVAIAGDLVESGGEQRDWNEFWRLTGPLAASTPLFPAPGNHEYYAGPGETGRYTEMASERAFAKYRAYFDLPPNGMGPHHERYYDFDWGPVSFVVLDLGNGVPHHSAADTNWYLKGEGEGGFAPSWSPGSAQYRWLEETLRRARDRSAFTFVMFHYCPYSSGPHGLPPGKSAGEDPLSGIPLQTLTPLFLRYGVDVLLSGHDEMYERSVVPGKQVLADGTRVDHALQVYDVGVGGDGLRAPVEGAINPYRVFLAHENAPEIRDAEGVLIDGGKHYGHLEINVEPLGDDRWQARLDMVYVFPVTDESGEVTAFERRLYDDSVTLLAPRTPDSAE